MRVGLENFMNVVLKTLLFAQPNARKNSVFIAQLKGIFR